ncbi:MAG: PIN domain nuclease [Desulfohalobiaceae bacterium]
MILVDSSVWIDYFNGLFNKATDYLDQALTEQTVLIGDLILMEVLQGFRSQRDFQTARSYLTQLECHVLCSPQLALLGAENYRFLRRKGVTIRKTVDMIIGTWCIAYNIPLLHADRDFDPLTTHLSLPVIQM